jgi:hypothetical protein
MNSNTTALEVFTNVRNAYRLLHDYQQMVIDAVRYIGSQFDITEWLTEPAFAGDAVQGYRRFEQSAWDWLPMMSAAFHFTKPLSGDGHLSLSILVVSDTGFVKDDGGGKDMNTTSTFDQVEDSKTQFAFFLYQSHPHRFLKDLFAPNQLHDFLRNGTDIGPSVTGKLYDSSCLCSEGQLNEVIQDILDAAHKQNLTLELRKNIAKV